jgi:hypothetical protein
VTASNKIAVLNIFRSFCRLVDEDMFPYGPCLGYVAQVGGAIQWHSLMDEQGNWTDFVRPKATQGEDVLATLVGAGRRLAHWMSG